MRGETAVQPVEELHVQPEAGRAHEADHHAVGPEGVHQGARADRVLEPPRHVLPGLAAVPAHILLGVPARGPQAQAGAPLPRGGVLQGVGGQADRGPAAEQAGAGAQRVQARQDQPAERAAVVGQQRVREPVAAAAQDTAVDGLAQLPAAAGAVQVGAAAHVHRGEPGGGRGAGRVRRIQKPVPRGEPVTHRHAAQPVGWTLRFQGIHRHRHRSRQPRGHSRYEYYRSGCGRRRSRCRGVRNRNPTGRNPATAGRLLYHYHHHHHRHYHHNHHHPHPQRHSR